MPRKPADNSEGRPKQKRPSQPKPKAEPKPVKPADKRSAADFLPEDHDYESLRKAAAGCQGCDLYKFASQTVFGEGHKRPRIMFIGEQPGDVEDKTGHVFVGPAGKLLDKALAAAGIERQDAYFTNAVKHFKYEWKGKRRIHSKPRRIEVVACRPWLEAEMNELKPDLVICLGATAAQAIMGASFRVTRFRGQIVRSELAPRVLMTVHPSSILRAQDDESRHEEMELFVEDLKKAAAALGLDKS